MPSWTASKPSWNLYHLRMLHSLDSCILQPNSWTGSWAQTYGAPPPAPAIQIGHKDGQIYEQALKSWVPEHPFLSGGGSSPSSVFEAAIAAHALSQSASAAAALHRELLRGAAANPFLSVFYPSGDNEHLPAEHIGIVYASARARLTLGETATLCVVDNSASMLEGEDLQAVVEISLICDGQERVVLDCMTDKTGVLTIGSHLADADIVLPHGAIEIGLGKEVALVAPLSIECDVLSIDAANLVVEAPKRDADAVVFLRTPHFHASTSPLLVVRNNVEFVASWPNARAYPWTSFAGEIDESDDTQVRDGLRRLRKFVTAFRAHGREKLGRFRAKIESPRMTKGTGADVLEALVREGILTLDGKWYILNADALGDKLGINYVDCHAYRFGGAAMDFVRRAIDCE